MAMKRVRETEEFDTGNGFTVSKLPDSFLVHLLSYAWRSHYRLALVNHCFLAITRSRAYWKAVACRALQDKVPLQILQQVDWFCELEPDEPLHFYLWTLWTTQPQALYCKGQGFIELVSCEARNPTAKTAKAWRLSFPTTTAEIEIDPPDSFVTCVLKLAIITTDYMVMQAGELFYATCWNNPVVRKEVYMMNANRQSFTTTYAEVVEGDHIWCGAIENACTDGSARKVWIPKIGFGVWVPK